MMFASVFRVTLPEWSDWEEEIKSCSELQDQMQKVVLQPAEQQKFSIKNGFLYRGKGLVLPRKFSRIPTILAEFHSSLQGGHSGFFRTFKRIAGVFYWAGMKQDIKNYIMSCQQCQQSKVETLAPAGLLQPIPIPTRVWTEISMDFIGDLPRAEKNDTILVVVDKLTKYAHFIPLGHPYTASEVASSFISNIVKLHGFLRPLSLTEIGFFLANSGRQCSNKLAQNSSIALHSTPKQMAKQRSQIGVWRST